MPNFLARVEIHDGEPEDYVRLNSHLAEIGYLDTYVFGVEKIKLPTGTYVCQQGVFGLSKMATYNELREQTNKIFMEAMQANPDKREPFVVVAPLQWLCIKHLPVV